MLKRLHNFVRARINGRRHGIIDDPNHPALHGKWDTPEILTINNFMEERPAWHAVQIYLTLRCPLACAHCLSNSHPKRSEVMDENLLNELIDELARLPITRYLSFFGGEPMLYPDMLARAIERTTRLNMVPSVVTSAHWAETEESARNGARVLRRADRVQVSTDRPHRRFVSTETTLRAVAALKRENIRTTVCYAAEKDEYLDQRLLPQDLVKGIKKLKVCMIVVPLISEGRAHKRNLKPAPVPPNQGCRQADIPLIDTEGRIFTCAPGWTIPREGNSSHYLGQFPQMELRAILQRYLDSPCHRTIRNGGPLAVLNELARNNPTLKEKLRNNPPREICTGCRMIAEQLPNGKLFADYVFESAEEAAVSPAP